MTLPAVALAGVVVASSGPSAKEFAVGRKLAATASVTLRQGDTLTVLDEKGTRVLRGPGTFSLSQASAPPRTSVFAALTRQRAAARVRTGAVRDPGAAQTARNPSLWYADIAKPGTHCIVDPANLRLWRAAAEEKANFRLAAPTGSAAASVDFEAGATVAQVDPAELPIGDGTAAVLADAKGTTLGNFKFAVLPSSPEDPEGLAEALIARGCTAQLELLASALALPG